MATFQKFLCLPVVLILLTACTPVVYERGNIIDPAAVDRIQVGRTNHRQVMELLGSPTFVNSFRHERWIYLQERHYESYRTTNRLEIVFDTQGIVRNIQRNFGDQLWDPEQLSESGPIDFLSWRRLTNPGGQDVTPEAGQAAINFTVPTPLASTQADALTSQEDRWWHRLGRILWRPKPPLPEQEELPPQQYGWWRTIWDRDPSRDPTREE
ncbi:MAG: outer membrane protein assembly factor BamE [Magnetococcales bacterium]|nr:outer membrane protein assembly factor BamE [Magnetococcales bacterium]